MKTNKTLFGKIKPNIKDADHVFMLFLVRNIGALLNFCVRLNNVIRSMSHSKFSLVDTRPQMDSITMHGLMEMRTRTAADAREDAAPTECSAGCCCMSVSSCCIISVCIPVEASTIRLRSTGTATLPTLRSSVWWTDLLNQQRWMPWPKSWDYFFKKKRSFLLGLPVFLHFLNKKLCMLTFN